MAKLFLVLILLPAFITSYSQEFPLQSDFYIGNINNAKSRVKEFADSNGHYELVASIDKKQINPGDSAIVSVFVTGYGQIKNSKIFISSSSSEIFEKLVVFQSLGKIDSAGYSSYFWGSDTSSANILPAYMQINTGLSFERNDSIIRFDGYMDIATQPDVNRIITESIMINPPLTFKIFFKDKARSDEYKLNMYYTYFNGNQWVGSIATLDFRINSLTEEYEVLINITIFVVTLLGLIIALIGIFPVVVSIYNFYKNFKRKKKDIYVNEERYSIY